MQPTHDAEAEGAVTVRKRMGWVMLLALALFGVAVSRAAVSCRSERSAAQTFLASGDLESAVLAARHAAEWYVPLDTCSETSLDLLDEVVAKADAAGNAELALFALRSERTSIMLTRGLTVPHADRLPRLHASIASRMAAERVSSGKAQAGDEARYRTQLEGYDARRPNPWLVLGGSLAFLGWIGAIAGFVWQGLNAEGRLVPGAAVRWGGAAVLLFALWLTLVRYA